jgi:hypothetical protein
MTGAIEVLGKLGCRRACAITLRGLRMIARVRPRARAQTFVTDLFPV